MAPAGADAEIPGIGESKITQARIAELEARVRELEDARQIIDLFRRWHFACNDGWNGKQAGRMEALDCLVEDATIEVLGEHTPGEGPQGIEGFTERWECCHGDEGLCPASSRPALRPRHRHWRHCGAQDQHAQPSVSPKPSLTRRTNYPVRTADGWRIRRATTEGGYSSPLSRISGMLNPLPAKAVRTPWKRKV